MLVANVLNAGFNWMFIYGHLGAPEMGAEGAALATTIARWIGAAGLVAFVYATLGSSRLGARPGRLRLGARRRRRARRAGRGLLSVGVPIGVAHGFEAGAFASLTVFAGWLGGAEVAAFGIVLNLFALPFMPALGLATAANIRVGQAFGRRDGEGAREAAWAALRIILLLQSGIGLGYVVFAGFLAGLYTGERRCSRSRYRRFGSRGSCCFRTRSRWCWSGACAVSPTYGRPPASSWRVLGNDGAGGLVAGGASGARRARSRRLRRHRVHLCRCPARAAVPARRRAAL